MSGEKYTPEFSELDFPRRLAQIRKVQAENNRKWLAAKGSHGFEITLPDAKPPGESENEKKQVERNLQVSKLEAFQSNLLYNELEAIQPHGDKPSFMGPKLAAMVNAITAQQEELRKSLTEELGEDVANQIMANQPPAVRLAADLIRQREQNGPDRLGDVGQGGARPPVADAAAQARRDVQRQEGNDPILMGALRAIDSQVGSRASKSRVSSGSSSTSELSSRVGNDESSSRGSFSMLSVPPVDADAKVNAVPDGPASGANNSLSSVSPVRPNQDNQSSPERTDADAQILNPSDHVKLALAAFQQLLDEVLKTGIAIESTSRPDEENQQAAMDYDATQNLRRQFLERSMFDIVSLIAPTGHVPKPITEVGAAIADPLRSQPNGPISPDLKPAVDNQFGAWYTSAMAIPSLRMAFNTARKTLFGVSNPSLLKQLPLILQQSPVGAVASASSVQQNNDEEAPVASMENAVEVPEKKAEYQAYANDVAEVVRILEQASNSYELDAVRNPESANDIFALRQQMLAPVVAYFGGISDRKPLSNDQVPLPDAVFGVSDKYPMIRKSIGPEVMKLAINQSMMLPENLKTQLLRVFENPNTTARRRSQQMPTGAPAVAPASSAESSSMQRAAREVHNLVNPPIEDRAADGDPDLYVQNFEKYMDQTDGLPIPTVYVSNNSKDAALQRFQAGNLFFQKIKQQNPVTRKTEKVNVLSRNDGSSAQAMLRILHANKNNPAQMGQLFNNFEQQVKTSMKTYDLPEPVVRQLLTWMKSYLEKKGALPVDLTSASQSASQGLGRKKTGSSMPQTGSRSTISTSQIPQLRVTPALMPNFQPLNIGMSSNDAWFGNSLANLPGTSVPRAATLDPIEHPDPQVTLDGATPDDVNELNEMISHVIQTAQGPSDPAVQFKHHVDSAASDGFQRNELQGLLAQIPAQVRSMFHDYALLHHISLSSTGGARRRAKSSTKKIGNLNPDMLPWTKEKIIDRLDLLSGMIDEGNTNPKLTEELVSWIPFCVENGILTTKKAQKLYHHLNR